MAEQGSKRWNDMRVRWNDTHVAWGAKTYNEVVSFRTAGRLTSSARLTVRKVVRLRSASRFSLSWYSRQSDFLIIRGASTIYGTEKNFIKQSALLRAASRIRTFNKARLLSGVSVGATSFIDYGSDYWHTNRVEFGVDSGVIAGNTNTQKVAATVKAASRVGAGTQVEVPNWLVVGSASGMLNDVPVAWDSAKRTWDDGDFIWSPSAEVHVNRAVSIGAKSRIVSLARYQHNETLEFHGGSGIYSLVEYRIGAEALLGSESSMVAVAGITKEFALNFVSTGAVQSDSSSVSLASASLGGQNFILLEEDKWHEVIVSFNSSSHFEVEHFSEMEDSSSIGADSVISPEGSVSWERAATFSSDARMLEEKIRSWDSVTHPWDDDPYIWQPALNLIVNRDINLSVESEVSSSFVYQHNAAGVIGSSSGVNTSVSYVLSGVVEVSSYARMLYEDNLIVPVEGTLVGINDILADCLSLQEDDISLISEGFISLASENSASDSISLGGYSDVLGGAHYMLAGEASLTSFSALEWKTERMQEVSVLLDSKAGMRDNLINSVAMEVSAGINGISLLDTASSTVFNLAVEFSEEAGYTMHSSSWDRQKSVGGDWSAGGEVKGVWKSKEKVSGNWN